MSDYRELLIGCGSRRVKDLRLPTAEEIRNHRGYRANSNAIAGIGFRELVTLDNNPDHKPDVLCDLSSANSYFYWNGSSMLPDYAVGYGLGGRHFMSSSFDEIHAYEVLEHIGAQGDASLFFRQFTEFHRILKPDGLFFATCPSWCSMWAWGDPSHTRVITSGTLAFLSQVEYTKQVGKTPMSDFRYMYKADFEALYVQEDSESLCFVLRAIK